MEMCGQSYKTFGSLRCYASRPRPRGPRNSSQLDPECFAKTFKMNADVSEFANMDFSGMPTPNQNQNNERVIFEAWQPHIIFASLPCCRPRSPFSVVSFSSPSSIDRSCSPLLSFSTDPLFCPLSHSFEIVCYKKKNS